MSKMDNFEKKTWREFHSHGLLWFVNSIIHVFGWAIVIELNDFNNITDVYPARVKFRGFKEEVNTKHYKNITKYMVENAHKLMNDFSEDTK